MRVNMRFDLPACPVAALAALLAWAGCSGCGGDGNGDEDADAGDGDTDDTTTGDTIPSDTTDDGGSGEGYAFSRTYGGAQNDSAHSFVETSDGGFLVVGEHYSVDIP